MSTVPENTRPGLVPLTKSLLRDSIAAVRAGGFRLIGLMLAFHLAAYILVFPLFGWLFRQALRATGMTGLNLSALEISRGTTITVLLIFVICGLAFWLLALQFATVIIVLRRSRAGFVLTAADVLSDLGEVVRKLVRPSSIRLLGYLFFLVPLTGFGFTSMLAQGITIPSFITGELFKSPGTAIGLVAFFVILMYLNLRYALVFPAFTLTEGTGRQVFRMSWRLTRDRTLFSLICATIVLLAALTIAGVLLAAATVLPTVITDAFMPSWSPGVAAYSLGFAQVLGAVLGALATATLAGILISYFDEQSHRLPDNTPERELSPARPAHISPRNVASAVIALSTIAALVLGTLALGTMQRLVSEPNTLVLGHRGFSQNGVENTLGGLDAAKAAGADMVEMDVMQTLDGQFVAMHDANLSRLADQDVLVKDLTLDELVGMPVHDNNGNSDVIPSFADYVQHAHEIGMPLLIEIKLNGGETPDHVELLIDELDSLGLTDANIYHSLDPASVTTLKQMRPDLNVGYTMAFGGFGAPETDADFIVVEEWTATQKLQDQAAAAGLGFMSWTVNDEAGIREMLRRNVDGIITDHPDTAVQFREEMGQSSGLASILLDAVTRFVKVA